MKKVLYILNNMYVGGTEKSFLNLVNTLPQEEYNVSLLLLERYGGYMEWIPERVSVVILDEFTRIKTEIKESPRNVCYNYIKKGKLLSSLGLLLFHLIYKITGNRTLYYRFALRGVKKYQGFDEINAYMGPMDFISTLVVYKCVGGKKIQWIHLDVAKSWISLNTCRFLYRKMDEIKVVSQEALRSLVSKIPEVQSKAIVSYNVVSRSLCRKQADDGSGFEDHYDGFRIVTLGRLSSEKGQDIVPILAKRLKNLGFKFKWYLIGDGTLRSVIEKEITSLGLNNEVCLLGTKTNPYPYLKDTDLYVQTSHHEAYCIALAEARAFDLPIVSTEFAGAHEQLDNLKDCCVVPRDEDLLLEAITLALKKKSNRGQNCE